jgi:hypothetical protein
MTAERHIRYDVPFAAALVITSALLTPTLGLAFWRTSDWSWNAAMPWLWLWVFTALMPTAAALFLHRRLNDLVANVPDVPDRIVRDLANARWLFLMFGSMTGLAALSLIVSR